MMHMSSQSSWLIIRSIYIRIEKRDGTRSLVDGFDRRDACVCVAPQY